MPCQYVQKADPCSAQPLPITPCACGCGGTCGCNAGNSIPTVGSTDAMNNNGSSSGSSIPSVGGDGTDAMTESTQSKQGNQQMSFPIINLNVNQSPSNTFTEDIRFRAPQAQPVGSAPPVAVSPVPVSPVPVQLPQPVPVQSVPIVPVVPLVNPPTAQGQTSPGGVPIVGQTQAPSIPTIGVSQDVPASVGVRPIVKQKIFKQHHEPTWY